MPERMCLWGSRGREGKGHWKGGGGVTVPGEIVAVTRCIGNLYASAPIELWCLFHAVNKCILILYSAASLEL